MTFLKIFLNSPILSYWTQELIKDLLNITDVRELITGRGQVAGIHVVHLILGSRQFLPLDDLRGRSPDHRGNHSRRLFRRHRPLEKRKVSRTRRFPEWRDCKNKRYRCAWFVWNFLLLNVKLFAKANRAKDQR